MRDFRFGFTLGPHRSRTELAETCAAAEAYGYDIAVAVDHLGPDRTSPFQAPLAASYSCDRLRVGTYVLNLGYWNPSILAREVATAAWLTGGRFELGLGAGIVKAQFDAARIPWHPFGERMDWVSSTISELDRLLAEDHNVDRPPLLVGGTSYGALRLASEHADIASFGGRFQIPGQPPGTMRIIRADEAAERVAFLRETAGPRAGELEWNAFVLVAEVTNDRRAAAERMAAAREPHLHVPDPQDALDSPFLLIGTEEQIAARLVENRERYNFSYITVRHPHMHAFGPIIKRVRSLG
jgi:probable F420-dependent oxidoreductase